MLQCVLAVWLATATSAFAQDTKPNEPLAAALQRIAPATLEDPSGEALKAFHRALWRASHGKGKARVAYFGDSHVASEFMTGRIRQLLQARFGDGGIGAFMPALPVTGYRHSRVRYERATGMRGVRGKELAQGSFVGLSGFVLRIAGEPAAAAFETRFVAGQAPPSETVSESLTLSYVGSADPGELSIAIDGGTPQTFSTGGVGVQTRTIALGPAHVPHRVELTSDAGAPITLLGAALEYDASGVVLDAYGVSGARAQEQLLWNADAFAVQLGARKPDLLVLAYGTNEATDTDQPIERHENALRDVLARAKAVAPLASCLLVGPTDDPLRPRRRVFVDRPRTAEVIAAQRKIAAESGCAFIDLVAVMGGPLSMKKLVVARPPLGARDYIHLSRLGYEAVGTRITDALLQGCPKKKER